MPMTDLAVETRTVSNPNHKWYIVHAYSNFEKKVAEAIREQAKSAGLEDKFSEILVPTEDVVEIRRGRKINTERKFFPGYVLVKMEMTDEAYHLVKNTPKVTGFLGSGAKPMPVSEAEVAAHHRRDRGGRGASASPPSASRSARRCASPTARSQSFNGSVERSTRSGRACASPSPSSAAPPRSTWNTARWRRRPDLEARGRESNHEGREEASLSFPVVLFVSFVVPEFSAGRARPGRRMERPLRGVDVRNPWEGPHPHHGSPPRRRGFLERDRWPRNSWLYQAAGDRWLRHAFAAHRAGAGPARRQHHGLLQGVQRPHRERRQGHAPADGDHRLSGQVLHLRHQDAAGDLLPEGSRRDQVRRARRPAARPSAR